MTEEAYLFDTYALLEIISGNEKYRPYLDCQMVINSFILAELCYKLIREKGKRKAFQYTDQYSQYVFEPVPEMVKEAMLFRANHKRKKLSMTDCISYIMAKKLGLKFLTGDKEFRNFPHVEFVQK